MADKKMLKVLLISVRADYGGGPEHIYRLINELKDKIEFFVACPCDIPYCDRYKELLGKNRLIQIPHRSFRISSLINLFSFLKENKIDLIHSHGKGAGIYSRLLSAASGLKCIHTFHGIHIYNLNYFNRLFHILLEKFLSIFTGKFIAVSDSEAEEAINRGLCSNDKINVIYNGVHLPAKQTEFNPSAGGKLNVITITRFDHAKNNSLLLNIIEQIKTITDPGKFSFIFLGSGPEENKIKQQAEQKQLNGLIRFAGFTDNTSQFLDKAFCYISTSRREGLPLGVLEAMSFGVPVVASDVPGNNDIITHGKDGFLFDLKKPESAADFIIRLSNDPALWKSLSENARIKAADKFSLNTMAERTYLLYKSILNREEEV